MSLSWTKKLARNLSQVEFVEDATVVFQLASCFCSKLTTFLVDSFTCFCSCVNYGLMSLGKYSTHFPKTTASNANEIDNTFLFVTDELQIVMCTVILQ